MSIYKQLVLLAVMILFIQVAIFGQSSWKAPPEADNLISPFDDKKSAAQTGEIYFNSICFVCHGREGKGDGINAASLERPPANFQSSLVQRQSDGALFWKMSEGNPPMLAFKETLSDEIRWQLVAYIRKLAKKSVGKANDSNVSEASTPATDILSEKNLNKSKEISRSTRPGDGNNVFPKPLPKDPGPVVNPFSSMTGKDIFKNICGACHSIGLGRVIGPDLKNVEDRHNTEWMYSWIRSSQSMVKAGDNEAVRLFKEYNEVVMPDQIFLTNSQIDEVLDYIKDKSHPPTATNNPSSTINKILNKKANGSKQLEQGHPLSKLGFYMSWIMIILVISVFIYLLLILNKLMNFQFQKRI